MSTMLLCCAASSRPFQVTLGLRGEVGARSRSKKGLVLRVSLGESCRGRNQAAASSLQSLLVIPALPLTGRSIFRFRTESDEIIARANILDGVILAVDNAVNDNGAAQMPIDLPDKKLNPASSPISGKAKRSLVVKDLQSGRSPFDILESMTEWSPPEFWAVVDYLRAHGLIAETLQVFEWWKQQDGYKACELHYMKFIRILGQAHMPREAHKLFNEMRELGLPLSVAVYTCLLQCYAECGHFEEAEDILKEMISSSDAKPNTVTYTGLIHAYGKFGLYDDMWRTFNTMRTVGIPPDEFTYRSLVKAYARGGLFNRMHKTIREMTSNDIYPDSATMNVVVLSYAEAGLVEEMEKYYRITREYGFNGHHQTIKAMVTTYARKSLFFQLGQFVKSVGMKRRTMGNFLWNSLLLSYAANFAMNHLEEQFENMKHAGFTPDLTTYNIMALAYAHMQQFWDLRVMILTMQSEGIAPDLVTYGAVVDAFLQGKVQSKLPDALAELRTIDLVAEIATDTLVFEVFGKGNLHVACETLVRNMQGGDKNQRTYKNLIGYYLQSLDDSRYVPGRGGHWY